MVTPRLTAEPWGKRRSDDTNIETGRLGLVQHSMDVAAVFEALVAVPSVRARLEQLAQVTMTQPVIARLSVLAFLHDIGKASAGFQSKALPDHARAAWLSRAGIRPYQCGHVRVVAALLFNRTLCKRMAETFPLETMLEWGPSVVDLWLAAVSHHGEPITVTVLEGSAEARWLALWKPIDEYDPMEAITTLGSFAQSRFPAAWHDDVAAELPSEPRFVHCFAGLVSLADWIGSNDDPSFFPYDGGYACRATFSRAQARTVIRRMRLDVEDARAALRVRSPSFAETFGNEERSFKPTPLQRAMEDRDLGPIVIAESETGSGKTEAALWRFKTLFESGEVDALAFLLPTRVAAVSLEKRVRTFAQKLFLDPELRPNVVLAVPGYIQADGEQGIPLPRFETLWPDGGDEASAHRRWAAERPKRFLAAAITVGTVDQALLSGLTVRHAHLRGAALLRALMVVDEVHASDAYMTQLLVGLLRRHAEAGGHALLLSATLGSEARERLLAVPSVRLRPNEKRAVTPCALADDAPYPSMTDRSAIRPVGGQATQNRVQVQLRPAMDEPVWIAAEAARAARKGAKVLVVRNTVSGAIAVQTALEAELGIEHPALCRTQGVPAPHHGRFAAQDRQALDEAVELYFGKDAGRGDASVLVGTQTLEQSLDIDADYLVTDLAPADVLLQRLGRLHRHRRSGRPAQFATPAVTVVTPSSRDLEDCLGRGRGRRRHGLGSVYDNLLSIEATWRELEQRAHLSRPAENRSLVEAVTRSTSLGTLAAELGPAWERHWIEYMGGQSAMRGAAEIIHLDWSQPWDDQPWSELGSRLRTRLGLDDRLATFSKQWTSPFGRSLDHLKIPGWMAAGAKESEELATLIEAGGTMLRFRWAERGFVYTRYGLELGGDGDKGA